MEWFYWALAAAAVYGIDNVVSKYAVDKHIRDSIALMMLLGLMDGVLGTYAYFFKGIVLTFSWQHLILLSEGFLYFIGRMFFFEAMRHEEASRVTTMMLAGPLLVALLAYPLLGEAFPPHVYLGILLMVSGSVLIAYRKVRGAEHHKGVRFTILSVLLMSLAAVCAKYTAYMGFWYLIFGGTAGYAWCSLLLFIYPKTRNAFRRTFSLPKHYLVVGSIYLIMLVSWLLYIKALMAGPISLVSTVTAAQSLFTLVYVVALSLFWPKILKEEIDKRTLGQKLLAALLMVWGVYLLA